MDNLDGSVIDDIDRFTRWKCGQDHIMGVTERVRQSLQINGKTLRYFTTQLSLFRDAVDLQAEKPAEIEVTTVLDGRTLRMVHRCTVCGDKREWHPEKDVVEFVASTYLAE